MYSNYKAYRSGADLAVALIMVDVCISVSFLMQRCPATMLQTSRGKYVCLCSWPTCKHGKCGYLSFILYLSKKYLATVHSTVWPLSNCSGKDCIWAGRLVTLQTRYLRLIVPQCVISILSPLISFVNLTRCESVSGFLCSLMSLMSRTSHMNSITGWAL